MAEPSQAPTTRPPWPDLLSIAGSTSGDCTDCDERFVNAEGDVMTGTLTLSDGSVVIDSGGLFVKEGLDLQGDINQQSGGSATLGRVYVQNNADFLGDVTLDRDPDQPMEAATKQYVDSMPGQPGPSGHTPVYYHGDGPPTVVVGAQAGDCYIDDLTGDLYQLQ